MDPVDTEHGSGRYMYEISLLKNTSVELSPTNSGPNWDLTTGPSDRHSYHSSGGTEVVRLHVKSHEIDYIREVQD